jgi:hypothetical protein
MATLTAANSSFTITLPNVFPVPIEIEGYATDDAFEAEAVKPSEVMMGVDGVLSAGYVPYPTILRFTLQANSPSIFYLDIWREAMDARQETFAAQATIAAPSLGKLFTFNTGYLTSATVMPPGKKMFQPAHYEITFQNSIAAPA